MSIEKQAVAGLKWAGISKLISQVINWAITLLVLRLLVPSDYGLMAILSVFIGLLGNIADLGLGASLVQAKELSKQEIASTAGLVLVVNVAVMAILLASAPLIAWFYAEPRLTLLTQVAASQFLFNAVAMVPQALAYRDMQFRRLSLIDLLVAVVGGATTVVLALNGAGVWALLLGNVAQSALRALLLSGGRFPRPSFKRAGMRGHVQFGSFVMLLRLASQLISQSDIIIAGRVLSQQAVGLYSVSLHLATLPMQKIMGTINQVALPTVAKLQLEHVRLRIRMLEATRLLMLVTIPLLWGMSSIAPDFIRVVLGVRWIGATLPMQAICLVVPLQLINAFYSTAALGMRDVRANVYNMAASAIVLPAAFLVGSRWGVNGLAYAWLVAIPLVFLLRLPGTAKSVGVTLPDLIGVIWKPVTAAIVMYAGIVFSKLLMGTMAAGFRLAALVAIGASLYAVAVVAIDRQAVPDARKFLTALRA